MKLRPYIIPIVLVCVICLFIGVFRMTRNKKEPFGFSNGTLIQLSTSHVPTVYDQELEELYRKQVKHDLIDMTGSA